MALTELQRAVCRCLAAQRLVTGEAYVAGGAALNELLSSPRVSRDIDVFHDSDEALRVTWGADRRLLESAGFALQVLQERPAFVEVEVSCQGARVLVEWARDSAYRFFPLVEHPDFGLTLHPFDLATNKVLALVGRLEVRDWVDLIQCDTDIQPLGYLVWAASGKDPGLTPLGILDHAARQRYAAEEVLALAWSGTPPDPADMSRRWRMMLADAARVVRRLPPESVGRCVLTHAGGLFRGGEPELGDAISQDRLQFHSGCIRGAFPRVT